jgi:peroxiredoxin
MALTEMCPESDQILRKLRMTRRRRHLARKLPGTQMQVLGEKIMSTIQPGADAPDFSLTDLNGESVQLSAMLGTPVVLNFFHTGCTWSRAMLPQLDTVYDKYPELDVTMLAIAVGEDTPESVRAFVHEQDINIFTGIDSDKSIRAAYGLERVPSVVLIDREGRVDKIYQGSTEQLPGIVDQAVLALADTEETPDFTLIGNGCAP